jgi:hypothetical protein
MCCEERRIKNQLQLAYGEPSGAAIEPASLSIPYKLVNTAHFQTLPAHDNLAGRAAVGSENEGGS